MPSTLPLRTQGRRLGAYGAWHSPLSAEAVAGQSLRLMLVRAAGSWIYWTEQRPAEGGRTTIMRARPKGRPEELLPAPFSARSRVHEYGGGELLVVSGAIYFVNDADQQIYEIEPGEAPQRLTDMIGCRFADMVLDGTRGRLVAVMERRAADGSRPENLLVEVLLDRHARGSVRELVTGADFYAAPCVSPDGERLAFLSWRLPAMPWESAALSIADLDIDGLPKAVVAVAGGGPDAASEPTWLDAGRLLFIADAASGFANLHVREADGNLRNIAPMAAEFGRPLWQLGGRSYAPRPDGRILASYFAKGRNRLGSIDWRTGAVEEIETSLASLDQLVVHPAGIAAIATRDKAPPALVSLQPGTPPKVLRATSPLSLAKGTASRGRPVEFPSSDEATVFGVYYPPANGLWQAPKDTSPPAIVLAHGGPTAMAERGLRLKIQFWTSRGFAILDVDYAGSTGYGRRYRRRLDGKWGVRDVADLVAGANFLARERLADAERIAISGGSAGGYSVLMALATTTRFAAGSCYYGISNLELLLEHTHKFESGYLHNLLGTMPEHWRQRFAERSPIHLADRISSPLILFQGKDDKVVAPEQSRIIVEALTRRRRTVEYWEFEGEGHGFRRASTIATCLERELAFFQRVFEIEAERE
jgi:dipeptidyl aminopeptidase/acylaminoacyl peptidase